MGRRKKDRHSLQKKDEHGNLLKNHEYYQCISPEGHQFVNNCICYICGVCISRRSLRDYLKTIYGAQIHKHCTVAGHLRCLAAGDAPECFYCKKELTLDEMTPDHVIPKSKGGTDWLNNIVIACESCNKQKQADIYYIPSYVEYATIYEL